ncbi:MAG: adenosylcobinamide-GDP ribazoletransferase [Rhodospirillaceae bacterium]|nr:adenosylcobinamide-GDP ribazoletransferase [Rhodospirillaceae bacterium]
MSLSLRQTLRAGLRDLQAATVFLTRLPVPWPTDAPADQIARAAAQFPAVGAALGAAAGLFGWGLAGLGAPLWLAAGLAIAALVAATGGLHEDGLADLADGLGGGTSREAKLAIMRDSRVGTYGALALAFSLLLRTAAVAPLVASAAGIVVLAMAAAASRAAMTAVFWAVEPARADGLAAANRPCRVRAIVAGAWAFAIALVLGPALLGPAVGAATAAAVLILAGLAAVAVALLARRALGGHTGDVLGAVQQAAEIAALAGAATVIGGLA